jgi:hypothetical protein
MHIFSALKLKNIVCGLNLWIVEKYMCMTTSPTLARLLQRINYASLLIMEYSLHGFFFPCVCLLVLVLQYRAWSWLNRRDSSVIVVDVVCYIHAGSGFGAGIDATALEDFYDGEGG